MLVGMDVAHTKLPRRTDRDQLTAVRERLVELLDRRDRLNEKLIELYTGKDSETGGGVAGADAAERKGRQKEYNRQRKLVTLLMRRGTSNSDKERIFALLDERVELSGILAASQFRVKKDKLRKKAKKEQLKIQRATKKQLRKNKHQIEKAVSRAKVRSIRKKRAKKQMIAGWIGLFLLCAAVFLVWFFRKDIGAALTDAFNGLLGNVLGNL